MRTSALWKSVVSFAPAANGNFPSFSTASTFSDALVCDRIPPAILAVADLNELGLFVTQLRAREKARFSCASCASSSAFLIRKSCVAKIPAQNFLKRQTQIYHAFFLKLSSRARVARVRRIGPSRGVFM